MLRQQCAAECKTDVCERIIRRQDIGLEYRRRMPRDLRVVQYFGLSHDEPRRVSKVKNRFDCVAYLKEQNIPHEVPRCACVFCPYKSDHEWLRLKENDPAGWPKAVEVDEARRRPGAVANRRLEQSIYLHRSCLPLVEVDLGGRT